MSIILNQSIHGKFIYIQYFSKIVLCYVAGIWNACLWLLYSMNHRFWGCGVWVRIMFILKSNHNNNCDVWLKGIACNCLLICDLHYWEHDGNGDRYCMAFQWVSRLCLNLLRSSASHTQLVMLVQIWFATQWHTSNKSRGLCNLKTWLINFTVSYNHINCLKKVIYK